MTKKLNTTFMSHRDQFQLANMRFFWVIVLIHWKLGILLTRVIEWNQQHLKGKLGAEHNLTDRIGTPTLIN